VAQPAQKRVPLRRTRPQDVARSVWGHYLIDNITLGPDSRNQKSRRFACVVNVFPHPIPGAGRFERHLSRLLSLSSTCGRASGCQSVLAERRLTNRCALTRDCRRPPMIAVRTEFLWVNRERKLRKRWLWPRALRRAHRDTPEASLERVPVREGVSIRVAVIVNGAKIALFSFLSSKSSLFDSRI